MQGGYLSVETPHLPRPQTPCVMRLARTLTLGNAAIRAMCANKQPMPLWRNTAHRVPFTCRSGANGQFRTISCIGATSEDVVRQRVQLLNPAFPTLMRDSAVSPTPPHLAQAH